MLLLTDAVRILFNGFLAPDLHVISQPVPALCVQRIHAAVNVVNDLTALLRIHQTDRIGDHTVGHDPGFRIIFRRPVTLVELIFHNRCQIPGIPVKAGDLLQLLQISVVIFDVQQLRQQTDPANGSGIHVIAHRPGITALTCIQLHQVAVRVLPHLGLICLIHPPQDFDSQPLRRILLLEKLGGGSRAGQASQQRTDQQQRQNAAPPLQNPIAQV